MNQEESQLMEQMTMETMTNLSTQLNPSISLPETIDIERLTARCNYRPLSSEKRIRKSISKEYPPPLHLAIQTDQNFTEQMVAGRSFKLQSTKMDIQPSGN
ncbi:MAG: hypothetical protein EZS28_038828 [Streblomastix strix]|uniref:Uncharacterized protein n=1 Tax=Streblomastix strix TaxID=222440 RepID=A0A5J4U5R4_9EUKA|nr:MAG: hypothetical protein EZS28_038828 [Streblomastix strix]